MIGYHRHEAQLVHGRLLHLMVHLVRAARSRTPEQIFGHCQQETGWRQELASSSAPLPLASGRLEGQLLGGQAAAVGGCQLSRVCR